MICKKCGATIDDNSLECKFCGAKFGEAEAPAEAAASTQAAESDAAEASAEAAAVAAAQADDFEYSGEEIDKMLDENAKNRKLQMERLSSEKQKQLREIEKRRESKRRKQRRNRVLIVLAILAGLGAVGTGVYYLNINKGSAPEVEVVTEEPEATQTVVSDVATEEPDSEDTTATEAPAEAATQAPSWQGSGSGGTGTGGSGSSGGSAVSGGSGGSSSGGGTSSSGSGSSGKSSSSGSGSGSSASSGTKNTVTTSRATTTPDTKYSAKGGYDGEKFTAALITGGTVVENGSKKYMTFDFNGATYYANIDSGSSTADISGKPMTINAYKTSEVYNGSNIYEITALTKYDSSYVFPESGYKLLTEADLKGKTSKELYIGRNEIYARHGRQFKDRELQTYFNSCPWYTIKSSYNTGNDAANLNSIEIANANFIKAYEESHK